MIIEGLGRHDFLLRSVPRVCSDVLHSCTVQILVLHKALLAAGQSFDSQSIILLTMTLHAVSFISFTFGQSSTLESSMQAVLSRVGISF